MRSCTTGRALTGYGSNVPDGPFLPPTWRRLYAHVRSLDAGCPVCGKITSPGAGGEYRQWKNAAYDDRRAIYTCPRCQRRWYVGVIFWPLTAAHGAIRRPADHVLTPGEALQMRQERSAVSEGRKPGRQTNLRCTCGDQGCPVHPEGPPAGWDPEE